MATFFTIFPIHFLITTFFLLFSTAAITNGHGFGEEKTTHLHFFMHEVGVGPNKSAFDIFVGVPNKPYDYGKLIVMDHPLTEGTELSSKLIGRAQGMYMLTSLEESSLIMIMNFIFEDGEFNGSSLAILGRNPYTSQKIRELPVIGGTGHFRLARGYLFTQTYRFDITGDSVLEYDVYVKHL